MIALNKIIDIAVQRPVLHNAQLAADQRMAGRFQAFSFGKVEQLQKPKPANRLPFGAKNNGCSLDGFLRQNLVNIDTLFASALIMSASIGRRVKTSPRERRWRRLRLNSTMAAKVETP